ncbi:hypothetical protein [Parvularcula bermudensis]|uniref:hypothetical protein n=1 Tax=Parvularcula bermudensis TaxID=208216 RepID=UPI0005A2D910|nr:hypothetical protein [Parvularcula bermudensis]
MKSSSESLCVGGVFRLVTGQAVFGHGQAFFNIAAIGRQEFHQSLTMLNAFSIVPVGFVHKAVDLQSEEKQTGSQEIELGRHGRSS